MNRSFVRRQMMAVFALLLIGISIWAAGLSNEQLAPMTTDFQQQMFGNSTAKETLENLEVKGRSPKTGYQRRQFGDGWGKINGCSVREVILARDMTDARVNGVCQVSQGVLEDPYTGKIIQFRRGEVSSQAVQIDHVVALSDAWQKGAQALSFERRVEMSNDPLNLLAVDGPTNQHKGDGDAATWLPPNKGFRCQYVARQIAVKAKYYLWVTDAEKAAMHRTLDACPG